MSTIKNGMNSGDKMKYNLINLTNLVKEYKEKKDKTILDKIYGELKPIVKDKADYVFYKK